MKKLFLLTLSGLTALAVLAPACTKKIDEAYANPNADVRVPIEQLLPPLISCMAANSAGHGVYNDYRFLGKYIQNWQFCNSGDAFDRMSGRLKTSGAPDNTASIFRIHYYDIGQNLVNMIKWSIEEKKWDFAGVGKAIFAWSWLTLTDVQGECILKQAFDPSRLTFTYDTQEEVYDYVRQLCYESLDLLSKTGDGVNPANLAISDAYLYSGDLNKWKKFVYAVLARSYNHLSNKASLYKPDSVIYYCNQSILTNADNALVKFAYVPGGVSGAANFMGPFRGNLSSVVDGTNTAIRQGAYIANLLNGTNSAFPGITDPRAIYMIRKNAANTFKGLRPNKGNADAALPANDRPENFWGISQTGGVNNTAPGNDNNCRFIFKNAAPLPVIIASEVLFMKAEAAFRKGDKTTALAAYKEAISQHFDFLTTTYNQSIPTGEEINATNKAAYINNTTIVPLLATDLNLTKIMLQKYIALFGIGICETWTDMRRFHYSDIDPATSQQVYRDFIVPSGTDLYPDNLGVPVYRVYPRFNSETVWNLEELRRIGADKDDFHTKECWFSKP
jgi:hypothetical protein